MINSEGQIERFIFLHFCLVMALNIPTLLSEISYRTSRSSGPGGQNVNKTETRVEVIFPLLATNAMSELERDRAMKKLRVQMNRDGTLVLACSDFRTQLANKKKVTERLIALLELALVVPKPRKKSKPSKSAIQKRLDKKRQAAEVKKNRGWRLEP